MSWRATLCLLLFAACVSRDHGKQPQRESTNHIAAPSGPTPVLPDLVVADATRSVAQLVQRQTRQATRAGRRLIVYASASWCEPCQRFQQALAAGQLNDALPGLRFLKFDSDRDSDALQAAGYRYEMIPYFAWPRPDGTCTGQSMEGSIHGERAVADNLLPRLRAFLAQAP